MDTENLKLICIRDSDQECEDYIQLIKFNDSKVYEQLLNLSKDYNTFQDIIDFIDECENNHTIEIISIDMDVIKI